MFTKILEFKIKGYNLRGVHTSSKQNNDEILLCLPGFGRPSSSEIKFKALADNLIKYNIDTLRIDFLGCGISDGEFKYTTVKGLTDQTEIIINNLLNEGYRSISIVSHSLGGCIALCILERNIQINKMTFISPAFNQKMLQRYWFTKQKMKDMGTDITYQNFIQYFNEDLFIKECQIESRMTKNNFINKEYFLENLNLDYSIKLDPKKIDIERLLFIQGLKDETAPFESQNFKKYNMLLIENGDHDLERPDFRDKWLDKTVEFLIK